MKKNTKYWYFITRYTLFTLFYPLSYSAALIPACSLLKVKLFIFNNLTVAHSSKLKAQSKNEAQSRGNNSIDNNAGGKEAGRLDCRAPVKLNLL